MQREEQLEVWANAYNAALTGLLGSNVQADAAKNAPNVVQVIAKQCRTYADQAVEDAQEYEKTVYERKRKE